MLSPGAVTGRACSEGKGLCHKRTCCMSLPTPNLRCTQAEGQRGVSVLQAALVHALLRVCALDYLTCKLPSPPTMQRKTWLRRRIKSDEKDNRRINHT
jgi:hypothetical protein